MSLVAKSGRKTILAVLLLFCVAAVFYLKRHNRPTPPVVILLLDTLRADHLSTYGYERATSPELDRFAAENVKYDFAVSPAPWTPPSVASILSGMYPPSHGLMPPARRADARTQSKVDVRLKFLGDILKESGYSTAAVSPNPWITEEFGFTKGFESFQYLPRAPAEKINEAGFALVNKFKQDKKPFFLYLHYLDTHWPYEPPPGYENLFAGKLNVLNYDARMLERMGRYDGEIKYLDSQIGKLIQFFKDEGIYDDMILVAVGDHGEQFMEHGFTDHGNVVFNVETHVPLFIRAGKRNSELTSRSNTVTTVDILATILDLLSIEKPQQSALSVSLLDEESQHARAGVLSEIERKLKQRSFVSREGKKLIIGGSKRKHKPEVENPAENIVGMFDSRKDHFEETPLNDPQLLADLQAHYISLSKAALALKLPEQGSNAEVSEETLEQLKSLGYID